MWAAGGLGTDEVSALYAVREFTVGEVGEVGGLALRTQLVGLGQPSDFRCPLFDTSRTWVSATPFVVSRHLKKRGAKRDPRAWFGPGGRERMEFVRGVAAEEWARRSVDGSRPTIEAFDAREVRARLGWQKSPWEFRRGRSKVGDDGMRRPHAALRISFDEPIAGPLCLGYAAHFGLGLFVPKMPA